MGLCHSLFISFVEFDDGLYTLAEYVERHVLVGRVDGVALKTEAHQHSLYAQYALKVAYDRYASAAAHCQRLLAEGLLTALFGSLICRHVYLAHVALATLHGANLYF